MKVLVIGSGGREHALCHKLAESKNVEKIYCAPGNGGTSELAKNIDIQANDIEGLLKFAKEEKIDLTIVGPEDPLVMGIVDSFKQSGLRIFGPNKACARLEASKDFSKKFMEKNNISTAEYNTYTDLDSAIEGLKKYTYPLVIKADGLCLGKGVIICQNEEEAKRELKKILKDKIFGNQGEKVVIEEFLHGIEASLLCLVSNGKIFPLESAKDYKKIFDGDEGPNTGGVGCYSPSPLFTDDFKDKIKKDVLDKIQDGFAKEEMNYTGILFIGFMIDGDQIDLLEFNVRFGDPETEVLLPRLQGDLFEILNKTIDGELEKEDLKWKKEKCATVVLTSKGYPETYVKGFEISGRKDLDDEIILFHNGTKYEGDKLLTNGGRVLSITRLGKTLEECRESIYLNIEKINFDGMYYRKDIGLD